MFPDRRYFTRLAAETRFQPDALEKVYRLVHLLGEMNDHPLLDRTLALKGGTAVNLLYFDCPRLSVDIDLDYVGSPERESTQVDRTVIEHYLGKLLSSISYMEERHSTHALHQSILRYRNSAGNIDRINMEINFGLRVPVLGTVVRSIKHFFDLPLANVKTLNSSELFGVKAVALLDRMAPRDLFDIANVASNPSLVNSDLLRKSFIFYGCIATNDYRALTLDRIERIGDREIRTHLLPMLRKRADWDPVDVKAKVAKFMRPIFQLTENEVSFVGNFYKGIYAPELLFGDVAVNPDIVNHPMARWKMMHIRR